MGVGYFPNASATRENLTLLPRQGIGPALLSAAATEALCRALGCQYGGRAALPLASCRTWESSPVSHLGKMRQVALVASVQEHWWADQLSYHLGPDLGLQMAYP